MSFDAQKLYNLLPAVYRLRDAQIAQAQNLGQGPLQALIAVIAEQLLIVQEDLDQLYDDQFIETCAPWVIPYIGDLIGYQAVNGIATAVANPRAEVANTISLRRRKGTVLVMEQLARDVTGWGAHAVEFFMVLADTQYMNHIRPYNYYAPNLRRWQPKVYMDTAFDTTAHKVDVRRIAIERGRYNIQNIGIFLWSLNSYRLTKAQAALTVDPRCFRFNPLGADMPLFNNPISQGSDITALAQPMNVPDRLRRWVLYSDIQCALQTESLPSSPPRSIYYGENQSLALYIDGVFVEPSQIRVVNLAGAEGEWANLPATDATYLAAIDPELGRIALSPDAASPPAQVTATFFYGFNADMGGGEYSRSETFTDSPTVNSVPGQYSSIQAALDALPGNGVVEITDSSTYSEPGLVVYVAPGGHIEIRAADESRPTLILSNEISVTGGASSSCDLNGLVIACQLAPGSPLPPAMIHVPGSSSGETNQLSQLALIHCTLVPGWALTPERKPVYTDRPALVVESSGLNLEISNSILGPIWISRTATASLSNSILDATAKTGVAYTSLGGSGAGGALQLVGCTVVGTVHATLFTLISDSIIWAELPSSASPPSPWTASLLTDRRQDGCVRFSYVPADAVLPRNFECVIEGQGVPQPLFVSLRYGDPGYGKLFASTDDTIRRGADDGGEMGAFHFVLAPMRETDLMVRMQEYIPVGMEFGIFYQT